MQTCWRPCATTQLLTACSRCLHFWTRPYSCMRWWWCGTGSCWWVGEQIDDGEDGRVRHRNPDVLPCHKLGVFEIGVKHAVLLQIIKCNSCWTSSWHDNDDLLYNSVMPFERTEQAVDRVFCRLNARFVMCSNTTEP
jgi:hypothetical protein